MMRRTLASLCALLLAVLPLAAFASGCNDHPEAGLTSYYGVYHEADGAAGHISYHWGESFCNKCGAYVGITGDVYHEYVEEHLYKGDVCSRCGYNRVVGMATSVQSGSTVLGPKHLLQEITALGKQAEGANALMLATAPLRFTAEVNGFSFNKLSRGTTCVIEKVEQSPDQQLWYYINADGQTGWVRAALLRAAIDPSADLTLSSETLEPQTLCKVTVSGNARAGGSTDFDIVGKVQRGEIYVVTGESRADGGRLWYEIALGDISAWVSSGIVELIEQ